MIPVIRSPRVGLGIASRKVRSLVEEAGPKTDVFPRSAILLSGGPDSTILAYLLKKHGFSFEAYTVSLEVPQFPTDDSAFMKFFDVRAK